eukprot:TRINITY_DN7097_c0_g1_i1.p1 TRINITY_DN7097_c0_g1~~TRINITY_DN7097_c0_g1_i1.p1  ORF type:complete len:127 (-),score=54.84 TRINITY_DN7097_c0_g1_i1:28-360(-)
MEDDEDQVEAQPATKGERDQAADLNKVVSMLEEKELNTSKAEKSVKNILNFDRKKQEEKNQRAKELAAVKIKDEDVELMVSELEIPKNVAETILREHNGDVTKAIEHLIL